MRRPAWFYEVLRMLRALPRPLRAEGVFISTCPFSEELSLLWHRPVRPPKECPKCGGVLPQPPPAPERLTGGQAARLEYLLALNSASLCRRFSDDRFCCADCAIVLADATVAYLQSAAPAKEVA